MAKKGSTGFSQKVDHICRVIFLTEEGKPKSPTLLYSFCLAVVFFVVCLAAYFFGIDLLENALRGSGTSVRNLAEIILPGLAAAIPCALSSYLFRERRNLVCAAYAWMGIVLVLMALVMIPCCEDLFDYGIFWEMIGFPLLVSVICGGGIATLIYRHRK